MLVSKSQFSEVLKNLKNFNVFAVDTETTGLRPYLGDELFSIIVSANDEHTYYFNFNPYDAGFDKEFVLSRSSIIELQPIFAKENLVFMHNAKFDMAMLSKEGIYFDCEIHDTEVVARLIYNEHMTYDLDSCASRIGLKKDDAVEEYITKHKLWEWEPPRAGKKKREKKKFYDRVPPRIIIPYGCQDAKVTRALGVYQREEICKLNLALPNRPVEKVYENEKKITKVCFAMEKRGLRIDPEYCKNASNYEKERMETAAADFQRLTQIYFVDSAKVLSKAFEKFGIKPGKTEKGNDSFTDEVLSGIKSPLSDAVLRFRKSSKLRNTYYENFITLADSQGILHANIKQAGTKTTRFSMADPNLQNVPHRDEDEEGVEKEKFTIRRAVIPMDGSEFFELDYKAMELRLMLDYAQERLLIEAIRDRNHDPHQATADQTNLTRKQAKKLNFGIPYGMGKPALAKSLNCSESEAAKFRRQFFDGLPMVEKLIQNATYLAKQRGYIYNWAGRRYYFDDPNFAYKAINRIISGGCAEIMKIAMVRIHELLTTKKANSSMVVQVHDSLLLQVFPNELDLIPEIVKIMRDAYPHKSLPMDVSCKRSTVSWDDMVDFKLA